MALGARSIAAVISVVLVGATLYPVLRHPRDDGFPLSTYPMFASRRPTRLTMDYAIGIAQGGERHHLPPWTIGSREVLQARAILARGVGGGTRTQGPLCRDIATRIASAARFADIVEIQLVTGTHDAVDYLVRKQVGQENVRATCKVVR